MKGTGSLVFKSPLGQQIQQKGDLSGEELFLRKKKKDITFNETDKEVVKSCKI